MAASICPVGGKSMKQISTKPAILSRGEFEEIFRSVSNWRRWGAEDERGTLNYITPQHIRDAAALVRSGQSVTLFTAAEHGGRAGQSPPLRPPHGQNVRVAPFT